MAMEFTGENFQVEVLESSTPVLVDFWADWCGPCNALTPTIEELAKEAQGYKVGKVDVMAQAGLAQRYKIEGIPALRLFKNGEIVAQMDGLVEKEMLESMIAKVLN